MAILAAIVASLSAQLDLPDILSADVRHRQHQKHPKNLK
jgi:hypothetical protein